MWFLSIFKASNHQFIINTNRHKSKVLKLYHSYFQCLCQLPVTLNKLVLNSLNKFQGAQNFYHPVTHNCIYRVLKLSITLAEKSKWFLKILPGKYWVLIWIWKTTQFYMYYSIVVHMFMLYILSLSLYSNSLDWYKLPRTLPLLNHYTANPTYILW